MDENTQTALISAVVSLIVTLATAYPTASIASAVQAKRDTRAEFRTRLQEILTLAVQYPHLENKPFCEGWLSRNPTDEQYLQYDTYCCMLFNLIEDVWKHARGEVDAIEEIISYEEWFVCHREWWTDNQPPNATGYHAKFYKFVEGVVQTHRIGRK